MNPPRALSQLSQTLSGFTESFLRFASEAACIICMVGLLLSPAHAAPPSRPEGKPAVAESGSTSKAVPSPSSDLVLAKDGERKANALAAFAEGLVAEEQGDHEKAFQAYRRALDADPNNTELAVKVAFELARRGETAEGIALLKDAAKAAPKDMLPPLCLSQIYAQFLKKPTLAIKNAALALELDPENIGPYAALIELYTEGKQPKKAEAVLDRAMKCENQDGEFWSQLADVCMRLYFSTEDAQLSQDKIERTTAVFKKALKFDPENSECVAKAADFYTQTKQYEPAIPLYRKAIAAEEEPDSEDALLLREKLARALMEAGHRDQALEVLEKMLPDAPQRAETHALIGDIHTLDGRFEKAIAAYQEVLRINPTVAPAYLEIANLQIRMGQADKAIETLVSARKKYPGTALITYSLAATLAQAHQYQQSLAMFEETLREAPASKPGLTDAGFYLAYGMAAEQAGEIDRAATLLQKSITLSPKTSAQACNYLGYMWVDRGMKLKEAGELIRRALVLEPNNGAYLDSLGWYYYKTSDYPKAVEQLQKALAALPEPDAEVLGHLGDVYKAMGETAKALESWEKALKLKPEDKELPGKIESAKQTKRSRN